MSKQESIAMATDKAAEHEAQHHRIIASLEKATKEEEQVERELDTAEITSLCQTHDKGIPATRGLNQRKATTVEACELDDDGSGQLAEKCQTVNQQADHFRCHK